MITKYIIFGLYEFLHAMQSQCHVQYFHPAVPQANCLSNTHIYNFHASIITFREPLLNKFALERHITLQITLK